MGYPIPLAGGSELYSKNLAWYELVNQKAAFCHGFCFKFMLDFLQWWVVTWKHKPNKSFTPLNCFLPEPFIMETERKLEHYSNGNLWPLFQARSTELCLVEFSVGMREINATF